MYLDIPSITEESQYEVDDVDRLSRGKSDYNSGRPLANLDAAAEQLRVFDLCGRTRETLAVELLESHPKGRIVRIDPKESVYDPVPIVTTGFAT